MHAAIIYAMFFILFFFFICAIYKIFSMRVYQKCTIIIKYISYVYKYNHRNKGFGCFLNNHIKYLRRIH